jgi:hypothetical protein
MRLRRSGVTLGANSNRRFENFCVQASNRAILALQVMKVKWLFLGWFPKDSEQITSLCLMLTRVRFVAIANPTKRTSRTGHLCSQVSHSLSLAAIHQTFRVYLEVERAPDRQRTCRAWLCGLRRHETISGAA